MFVRGTKLYGQEGRWAHDYQALLRTSRQGSALVFSIGEDKVVIYYKLNFVIWVLSFLMFPPDSYVVAQNVLIMFVNDIKFGGIGAP